jgi:hypothetical protein
MLPNIFALLKSASAVTAIIGSPPRVYRHGDAPQDVTRPYVTWQVVSGVPDNHLSGVPVSDRYTVQIDCMNTTDGGIESLAKAVRDAIEPSAVLTSIPLNERDFETKLYRIALQFDFILNR